MGKVEKMAVEIAVNPRDLECLINSVYNEMLKDGLGEYYCTVATEEERRDIVMAYIEHATKKFNLFSVSYMTNTEKKRSFIECVWGLLNESK